MKARALLPVFFHPEQLKHRPLYEWAFGRRIAHPETINRAARIIKALDRCGSTFSLRRPKKIPLRELVQLHDPSLVELLKTASKLPRHITIYPSVFPRRDQVHADAHIIQQAGYYCFDSGTPLTSSAWLAAWWSASAAYSAAALIASGKAKTAYALSRPPGHHASRNLFGGYCYFNNAAIAATKLREHGKVVVLDIDFHHGNGTQSFFYRDNRVLFLSVHGDPAHYYPFFSGYSTECGAGRGKGFTINIPLPGGCDGQEYLRVIDRRIIVPIQKYRPDFLVISAGFDTFRHDPIGDFALTTHDYAEMAARIARLDLPTAIIQEGGYATRWLGDNVASFLKAFRDG